tara:strand:- start:690 stop:1463 length:774 start_codon:yes stop_codon:yes gene_type:complete
MNSSKPDVHLDSHLQDGRKEESPAECSFQRSEAAIGVLSYLDGCIPRKVRKTSAESKATVISNWCLGVAIFAFIVALLVIFSVEKSDASSAIRFFVLAMINLSAIAAISSLIVPIVLTGLLAVRWKSLAFDGLCGDLRHEQKLADGLVTFDQSSLKDAQFWLERRINRISSRTTFFFGQKTAVLGLLAAGYSFTADLGGYQWISRTIANGITLDNWHNTFLLWIGAFVLGLSIGAIFLEKVTDRYRYQLELLELAQR